MFLAIVFSAVQLGVHLKPRLCPLGERSSLKCSHRHRPYDHITPIRGRRGHHAKDHMWRTSYEGPPANGVTRASSTTSAGFPKGVVDLAEVGGFSRVPRSFVLSGRRYSNKPSSRPRGRSSRALRVALSGGSSAVWVTRLSLPAGATLSPPAASLQLVGQMTHGWLHDQGSQTHNRRGSD